MKRFTRRMIIGLILVMTITIGVSGCMMPTGKKSVYDTKAFADKARDEMLQHMRDKYKKEFVEIFTQPRSWVTSYDEMKCYPLGGDPETDWARVTRAGEDGDIRFIDTFFSVIIREDIEAEINGLCKQLSLDSKTFYSMDDAFGDIYDSKKTYADLKRDPGAQASFVVDIAILFKENMDPEVISNKIYQLIEQEGLRGGYYIFFITQEGFDSINRINHKKILEPFGKYLTTKYYFKILPDDKS